MKQLTTIQIEKQTREELKQFGTKDQTYNEIIEKMMELASRQLFYERQKLILKNEEFVPLEKV
jgi:hypothetical protein